MLDLDVRRVTPWAARLSGAARQRGEAPTCVPMNENEYWNREADSAKDAETHPHVVWRMPFSRLPWPTSSIAHTRAGWEALKTVLAGIKRTAQDNELSPVFGVQITSILG